MSTFYITTAIDYPNGTPHVGHLYERLVADCYARWNRYIGNKVHFLTGTDENGQKLQIAAEAAGQPDTLSYVSGNVSAFKKLLSEFEISNDDFIRTTEQRHADTVNWIWETLVKKGDIYFGHYTGNYCFDCEAFYPDNQAPDGHCPNHGKPLVQVEEKGYQFKMSAYGEWITSYIESNKDFIFPSSAREEMLGRLRGEELRDLAISRPNKGWGIPVPNDKEHVIYTWFDALINYYVPIFTGQWSKDVWPASMHVIGKDITWFHAVIWPIMLKASHLDLPKQIHVHGMVVAEDGKKMSKSLGNTIDPFQIKSLFPLDSIRYGFLRGISSGRDGRIGISILTERHNNELANEFGNMVSRCIKLTQKRLGSEISPIDLQFDLSAISQVVFDEMKLNQHHKSLDAIWGGVSRINIFLNEVEPWRIKDDDAKFYKTMYTCLHGIYVLSSLLKPFLPNASDRVLNWLGMPASETFRTQFDCPKFTLSDPEPLFARITESKPA